MSIGDSGHLVAIDSMTLVWGVRRVGTPDQRQRTRWLFQQLEQENAQVILPAIALSEYLTPIPREKHKGIISALGSRFIVVPFDIQCASLAAGLFAEGRDGRAMDSPNARKCLRADCMIVASAFVHGARIFYSSDSHCRDLAKKVPGLVVEDMPEAPPDLFGYSDGAR